MNRIISNFSKETKKKHNIDLSIFSWYIPEWIVEEIEIGFIAKKKVGIDEARKIITQLTKDLVDKINASEKAQPFLKHHPFLEKHLHIFVHFENTNETNSQPKDYIDLVENTKGTLNFSNYNSRTGKFYIIHKESFKQATEEKHALPMKPI